MAKPIQYVVELNEQEAEVFIRDMYKPNPARDELIKRAKQLNFEIR